MIPQSLKTGLLEEENHQLLDLQERLLALVAVLVKRATKTSAVYCDHQGHQVVTPDIIIKALRVESMEFFDSQNLEDDMEEMIREIQNIDGQVSPETIVDHIISDPDVTTKVSASISECTCPVCDKMTSINTVWENYAPDDDAKMFLKSTLDAIHYP